MLHTKAALEREKASAQALLFSRKRHKNFSEVIRMLYKGERLEEYHNDPRIALLCKCFGQFNSTRFAKSRKMLKDVLIDIAVPRGLTGVEYIHVLFNIVGAREYWINDIYDWKPAARQKYLQIGDMLNFLFCKYPVAGFLNEAFGSNGNKLFAKWLIHLGRGGSPKQLQGIPLRLNNKGLHYFIQGNGNMSIAETLRWAQVRSLNGSSELARNIALSWLGRKPYEDEDFWYEFIQKVVNGGMFDMEKLPEIIDYVRDARRNNLAYSLKGRTLMSLLRQSDEWHRRFSAKGNDYEWKPSGVGKYAVEKDGILIKLEELITSRELANESKTMKHCVHSYAYYCAHGRSGIFSMRSYADGMLLETMATIEVSLQARKIVQAKGKMNRKISDLATKHMHAWAAREKLAISEHL